jgi:hypothetical protein
MTPEEEKRQLLIELEREERLMALEKPETIKREMELDIIKTELRKNEFLNQIKNGLGQEIKKNPNKVRFLDEERRLAEEERLKNRTFKQKIKESITKFFKLF